MKKTNKQPRRQATEKGRETWSIFDLQGLLSRIYEELQDINNKIINSPVTEYKNYYNRHYSESAS